MDKKRTESSLQKLECLLAPKTKQSYLFLAPLQWPWQGCCWNLPGSAMQLDTLAFLPHPTDITDIAAPPPPPPPRPFASVRFDPLAWSSGSDQRRISGCGIRWLLAGPDSLPLWLCRVCAFVLLRCFSCSHTVCNLPHVNAVFFFNSTCISLLIILVWLCMWQIIKNQNQRGNGSARAQG